MTAQTPRTKRPKPAPIDVRAACAAMGKLAPLELAQSWDNVGLLAGDTAAKVTRAMLCIDLMPAVVDEAVSAGVELVMAYHPPIFKPVSRLVTPVAAPEAEVHRCIAAGIAVYSMHTALDAADGGTNDCLAQLCGITQPHPLEHANIGPDECKIVVFVPHADTDCVADAMFSAGAGRIGDYDKCSFRTTGTGTFFGAESTSPAVGKADRLERVDEFRLEVICPATNIPDVVAAMVSEHPYEEPAYDIYPLRRRQVAGCGRVGRLPRPAGLGAFARKLKRATGAQCVSVVGDPDRRIERAIIVVGAAGSMPFQIPLTESDVIVTGEIRHHDALAIRRKNCSAVALSHWSSERPALDTLAVRLGALLPGVKVTVSQRDREPFLRV